MNIRDIKKKYSGLLDALDLDLIISHVLKKPREFVLAHPEAEIDSLKIKNLKIGISRRSQGEPLAYILGYKEFYNLNFKVNKHTLIPRPETELLVELAIENILQTINKELQTVIDVGTGSGNIIISIAKEISNYKNQNSNKLQITNYKLQKNKINYFATDISKSALEIAWHNAKKYNLEKKIDFFHGNLLEPIIKNLKRYVLRDTCYVTIVANLPYLSKKIYSATLPGVKNFEPKSALLSSNNGLAHYGKLLKQIKKINLCSMFHVSCFMEINPEQKKSLEKLIRIYFPTAKIIFHRDLARKWRVVEFRS